jgi:hypothetical protein
MLPAKTLERRANTKMVSPAASRWALSLWPNVAPGSWSAQATRRALPASRGSKPAETITAPHPAQGQERVLFFRIVWITLWTDCRDTPSSWPIWRRDRH